MRSMLFELVIPFLVDVIFAALWYAAIAVLFALALFKLDWVYAMAGGAMLGGGRAAYSFADRLEP